ncbi:hypothetical protein Tco_0573261 [Tanacetum coccineum]
MSTSTTHQQSHTDVGSETRPLMLERGSYIPWASRFRRYVNRKRENRKWLNKAIDEAPYAFHMFTPDDTMAMNLILIFIPNDIYNSVNACTTAKAMWKRVECLMRGTIQNKVGRETRFNNEFDQFVAKPGEAPVSVYNSFAQLMNDLERNDIIFLLVIVNTKFLNCLQPEWLKYVTQVHLAKRLTEDTFDDLFDYLQQFEKLVNASQAKKNTTPYYVTHPSSVVDYDDDYQKDVQTNYEDPPTSAMLLLAHAITQNFSNLTNNRLRTSSNTRNQAINDLLFVDASRIKEIEELSANICLMAIMQPVNTNSAAGLIYDSTFVSEVQSPSTSNINPLIADNHEQKCLNQPKIINSIIGDDQIDSNIIFDEPNGNVNSGSVEDDNNVHDSYALEQLARNAYKEAEKQQIFAKKVQQQNTMLTNQLDLYKEKILRTFYYASKSQMKMKEKMNNPIAIEKKQSCWTIDYKKLNALYEDFVPPKELYAEQKYFSYAFISSEKSSNATSSYYSSKKASMPSENPLLVELNKMKNVFQTLFELLQKNCKKTSIFYTSPEEIRLNDYCQQQVKPIVQELHLNFEDFKNRFQNDIKEMKDVFVLTENDLCETRKQNIILKDQLLEVNLKHEIECCVLLSHECVDKSLQNEMKKIQRISIEIQEGMQKRINILENDVQRCQKQSLDFELKLQHEKEKRKCESSLKNNCENSLGK